MKQKLYRWLGCILSAFILFSSVGMTALATDENVEMSEEAQYELEMQQVYAKPIESNARQGWPQGPMIYGESAIVVDMQTGAVLYEKGADERRYPASITKVLTALIAIENSSMDDLVTFSEASVQSLESGYAHLAMRPGEVITMKDALHALLLASANEVGYAIGETIAGSHEKFIEMMNERAKELGCKNSNFVNTNGMFNENHYTTPRDMALIAMEAYKHPEFREVESALQYTIPATNLEPEPRTFQQKHKMRKVGNKFYDERCVGGKTGYTEKASNTLITYMESEGRSLVCVDMCSRKDIFPDTKAMCDYAFSQFKNVNISEFDKEHKIVSEDSQKSVTLPINVESDQIKSKEEGENVNYYYNDTLIGSARLDKTEEVKKAAEKKKVKAELEKKQKKQEKEKADRYAHIEAAIIIIIIIALIIIGAYVFSAKNKEQRKKRNYYRWKRIRRIFKR